MAYKSSYNQSAIGIPGLLWLTLRDMSLNPGGIQKFLDQLDWIYDYSAGMIPGKSTDEKQAKDWSDRLAKILINLDRAEHEYDPMYENPDFSQAEADYRRMLKGIRREIVFLIIDAKLVDHEFQRSQEAPNPLED